MVFLTDGGISESQTDSVLQMVSPEAATAQGQNQNPYAGSWASLDATTPRRMRIFSLGIGHGVHRPLLDGLARRHGPHIPQALSIHIQKGLSDHQHVAALMLLSKVHGFWIQFGVGLPCMKRVEHLAHAACYLAAIAEIQTHLPMHYCFGPAAKPG